MMMARWECLMCGYVYDESLDDEDSGNAPGSSSRTFQKLEKTL